MRIGVAGHFNGMDLRTLEPLEGEYSFIPAPATQRSYDYVFRVPRQSDDGLVLELLDAGTMMVRDSVMLGQLLVRAGYDWSKPVLDDVHVVMDHVVSLIDIDVIEWTENEMYIEF